MFRRLSLRTLIIIGLAVCFAVDAQAENTDSTRVLYPVTTLRTYGMTIWDNQSQTFVVPQAQATIRHREKYWVLYTKFDLDKSQLIELTGMVKPYRWLGLQTGQFRTPVGYDVSPSEYNLYTVVPVNDIIPNTYDRGVMAIINTDRTTTMVAGINGEGYNSSKTDNETDVAYRLSCRINPVSASYSRQANSRRRYSAGSVMVRDKYLDLSFTKAMRAGDYQATVYQLQLTTNSFSPWRGGVQFSKYDGNTTFQSGSYSGRITTNQSITDLSLERRFGDLSRIRVEWLPFDGSQDQWRITTQFGFSLEK